MKKETKMDIMGFVILAAFYALLVWYRLKD